MDKEQARYIFVTQPYKLELIDEIPDEGVSLYQQGSFVNLCRGLHLRSTGEVKTFKLLSIAGAYSGGGMGITRCMLQRIYGTTFETQEVRRIPSQVIVKWILHTF